MRLKEISRTATFAWSPSTSHHSSSTTTSNPDDSLPLLATGTVSGALDETFSNVGHLEIWAPFAKSLRGGAGGHEGLFDEIVETPRGSLDTNARFNRLAWSTPSSANPRGVLAAGLETGEVNVWDVEKVLGGGSASDCLVFKNETHTGPVRGLDFNPISGNVFASGGINAELQIFDLHKPNLNHTAGPPSTKLTEITAVQWNPQVQHILASSSSSGFTSVWDLRAKREVIGLQYGGGAATGQVGGGGAGMQVGSRRGMSDVCWQPDTSTRLITSSEDDTSPIIMVWDLRNSRAPEKILSGHDKGVLSVSWCKQDPDMLLSCGKDNRTICWNPQTCEIIGELPSSTNWSFQTAWCPRNPDLLATASFDGKIGIHSLQGTQESTQDNGRKATDQSAADDIFGGSSEDPSQSASKPAVSLKQPPKWLKRPVSAAFGFGGQLVTTSNLAGASGKNQSRVVHLRNVVTESEVIERAKKLDGVAGSKAELGTFCEEMAAKDGGAASAIAGWKALRTLFDTNSRSELVNLLGFSKEEIAAQVAEAIKNFKPQVAIHGDDEEAVPGTPRDPAVTFADKVEEHSDANKGASDTEGAASAKGLQSETTPSETSTGADQTEAATEMTEPSLFGEHDDGGLALGTPQTDGAAADFFSSMATLRGAIPAHMDVPHHGVARDSSVAATIGSRASSVASDNLRSNTFKIYPSDESEVDRLITRALVLGDFDSAVTLSLSVDRFADALILAVRGGPELLAKTQKAYFERRTTQLPFLRLFQSIVSNDLTDIVQNADLSEWQEIFVVLCTFARPEEFNNLAEQLGQRIEYRYRSAVQSDEETSSKELRKNALLCYLAAGKLEKAVNIWVDELKEDEQAGLEGAKDATGVSRYSAHALALQTFIEKIAVFQSATDYKDKDLAQPTRSEEVAESGARSYRLAALYDRYYEYADLLATQGLIELAVKYVKQTPQDYQGQSGSQGGYKAARDRYLGGSTATSASIGRAAAGKALGASARPSVPSVPTYGAPSAYGLQPQPSQHVSQQPPINQPTTFAPYNPGLVAAPVLDQATNPYGSGATASSYAAPPPQVSNQYSGSNGYGASNYGSGPSYAPANNYGQPDRAAQAQLAPPPMARPRDTSAPIVPAAQRRDIPGWNDAPSLSAPKRPASAAGSGKLQPIMSPFPESQMSGPPQTPPIRGDQNGYFGQGPPPRSQTSSALPPPPARAGPPPPRQNTMQQQNGNSSGPLAGPRPASRGGPPPGAIAGPPPARAMSPLVPSNARVQSPQPPLAAPTQAPSPYQPAPDAQRASGPYGAPPGQGGPAPPSVAQRKPSTPQPGPARTPQPATPKYPPGDRSHMPPSSQPIFDVLAGEVARLKNVVPPQQRKFIEDTEKRLNLLFDELNCETVPADTLQGLSALIQAVRARDMQAALSIHVQILTQGNRTPSMGQWMTGLKQLIRIAM